MPIMEHACLNPDCSQYGQVEEEYYRDTEARELRLMCPDCGQKMSKVLTRGPSVVWARPFSYYSDKNLEGANADEHIAYRVRSTTRPDGKPEPVVIDSFKKQRDFCKDEGLVLPSDAGAIEATPDGHHTNTRGNKGSW